MNNEINTNVDLDFNDFNCNFSHLCNSNLGFNIFHLNIHSLVDKLDRLVLLLRALTVRPDVVVISETWLKPLDAQFYNIPGYNAVHNCRSGGYGGISIFISQEIEFKELKNEMYRKHQTIILDFETCGFRLGALYRDHRSGTVSEYLNYIDRILEEFSKCLFVGDMNIDILKENSNKRNYDCTLASNNFVLINKVEPQFYTFKTKMSLLDHAFTDIPDRKFNLEIFDDSISDHKALIVSLSVKNKSESNNERGKSKINLPAIQNELTNSIDANVDFACFYVILCNIIRRFQQLGSYKAGRTSAPWFCAEIQDAIDKKNYWYSRHRSLPLNDYIANRFKYFRNLVVALTRKKKKQYYCNLINSTAGDAKKLWKALKYIMYNKVMNTSTPIKAVLNSSNELIVAKQEICEVFNLYFVGIAGFLRFKLGELNSFKRTNLTMRTSTMRTAYLRYTDVNELTQIINSLNPCSANGIDGIPLSIVKYCYNIVALLLVSEFNRCIDFGTFPDKLKISKTIPIYKAGQKTEPSNYRPISIQNCFAKIFEKLIYKRLESFYTYSKFFNRQQFGFVPKSNTTAAVLNFITFLRTSLNSGKYTSAIFVDMSKAFDCVLHEILLDKLEKSGIRGKFLQMLKSYLTGRAQVVNVDGEKSNELPVRYGVPQGSILGPLLFLVYINDIFNLKLKGKLQLYADDVILMYSSTSLTQMYDDMEHDLAILYDWFYNNSLTVNPDKTSYIIFRDPRKNIESNRPLHFGFGPIKLVEETKYLGLTIDYCLSFSSHIDSLKNKIIPYVGVLHRIKYFVPVSARLSIYFAHINSQLCYLNVIWGSAAKNKISELSRLQNKAVRSVFYEEYRNPEVHTHDLYKSHRLMKLDSQSEFELAALVHKIKHDQIRHSLVFPTNRQFHRYETRRRNDYHLEKINNNYGRKSILHLGLKTYNKIPDDLKNITNFEFFKTKLKKYFLAKQD
jgi:exonuclease III